MSKTIFLLIFILSLTVLHAQSDDSLKKGRSIRESMLRAFGGEKNINRINTIEYTILDISYRDDSTITTRTTYRLDLQRKHIMATSQQNSVAVVKAIDDSGAWKQINGEKEPLTAEEKEELERRLFLNFLSMLQNEDLLYEHVLDCHYKGHTADVVRVSNPNNPSENISLFVSTTDGTVLSSTQQETGMIPQTVYYADELEYKPVGKGIIFPHAYQLFVDGEMAAEGRIVDVKVKSK